jgi:hypothetical protein
MRHGNAGRAGPNHDQISVERPGHERPTLVTSLFLLVAALANGHPKALNVSAAVICDQETNALHIRLTPSDN